MKKLVALVMGLMMMLMMVAGCGSDGPKKMVIGLDDNFAPMGYRNEKNAIVGMDIDLAREACKRAGMEVEFKPGTASPLTRTVKRYMACPSLTSPTPS